MRVPSAFARLPGPAVAAVAVWAAALAAGTACEPWDPEQREQSFALDGKHAEVTCEGCHGAPPFESLPTDCNSCHVPDQPCGPGETPPECHYYRDGQGQIQQCSVCHTTAGWDQADGGCEAPSPHGPDFFPLEGAHAQSCGSCHDATNYPQCDDNNDALCLDCHEADRWKTVVHFLDPATDWPAGTQLGWECEACHDVSAAVTNTDDSWSPARQHAKPGQFDSVFKLPHGGANDAELGYDAATAGARPANAITDPALWVTSCGSCHPSEPDDYEPLACTEFCHQGDIWDTHPGYGVVQGAEVVADCLGCHPAGRLGSGQRPLP